MTDQDLINELANHIEDTTDHHVRREEHGVVIDGDFEMFGGPDVKAEITRFFTSRMDVESYSVGVTAPAGSLTGPMVVDEISTVPNA